MAMDYVDLDENIRALMIEEVELDGENLYISSYFNEGGAAAWKAMLLEAVTTGSDTTLAQAIKAQAYLKAKYPQNRKTGIVMISVPYNAHETIAESNFSRFYLRGLCRYAMDKGIPHLIGYRAMAVENPRPGSQEKIGASFPVADTLADLRATMNGNPALGMPPGVGSGVLARLP